MLYNTFKVTLVIAAALGLLHMISEEHYVYIFFPIAIIIGVVFTFFDSNDREYLRRNGIDPDEISWFFPDYSDYGAVRGGSYPLNETSSSHQRTYPARTNNSWDNSADAQYARYGPHNQYGYGYRGYSNPEYKKLKDKCKRNFKITISKDTETDETENDGL